VTSNNPKLCVTRHRQNAHLLRVKSAFASVASLDFRIIRSPLKKSKPRPRRRKHYAWWLSGVAASVAILFGSLILSLQRTECPLDGNYVMINGRCYTDDATIRSATKNSLHSVLEDGFLTADDQPVNVMEMIENQLKDFDFLIDE
jgi:hypothetical protein